MIETLASSRARRLFILASVSLDRSGGAATVGGDPHPPDGKLYIWRLCEFLTGGVATGVRAAARAVMAAVGRAALAAT